MAKEKQTRRMIAMALAAAVTMSSVPVVAFAEGGAGDNPSVTQNADGSTTTTTKTESGDGTVAAPKVTLTVSETKDADGNTTSTVTTTETKVDNDKTGTVTTDKTETKTETVTPDGSGTTTETTTALDQTVVDDKGTATESDDQTVVTDVDSKSTVEKNENGKVLSDEGYEEGTETTTDVYSPETSVPIFGSDADGSDQSVTETKETTDETTGVTTKTEITTASVTDPETGVTTTTTTTVTTVTTPSDVEGGEPVVTTSTETKVSTSVSKTEGPDTDKSDGKWDYTETVSTTLREVTVTKGEMTTKTGDGNFNDAGDYVPQVPIELETLKQVWDESKSVDMWQYPQKFSPKSNRPDGYDFYFYGYTEDSHVDSESREGAEVDWEDAEYDDIIQFELKDATGTNLGKELAEGEVRDSAAGLNIHNTYCCDLSTGAYGGTWYQLQNLEDSDYYDVTRTEENNYTSDADHIRAIVNNGYWGTKDAYEYTDETTGETVKVDGEKGSLSYMKAQLQAAYDQAQKENKSFPITQDDIDNLTHGEAQAATQIAIWNYGNQMENVEIRTIDRNQASDPDENERVDRIAAYLTGLADYGEDQTEIITADKFIKDMSLTVGEKADLDETVDTRNVDADDNNDVYNADFSFALVVTPDKDKDDLIVKVLDGSGNVVKQARIAGNAAEGETSDTIVDHGDGSYTFENMELAERTDMKFNLKLEGAQYLKEGVYIYTANGGSDASQTFVGTAKGTRAVDVEMEIDLSFDVKEGTITKKHSWRKTWKDEPAPNHGGGSSTGGDELEETEPTPEEPTPEEPTPENPTPEDPGKVLGDDEELLDIGDEGAPKDDMLLLDEEEEIVAATGDSNHMAGAFGGMFAALAGMLMLRKKKEN